MTTTEPRTNEVTTYRVYLHDVDNPNPVLRTQVQIQSATVTAEARAEAQRRNPGYQAGRAEVFTRGMWREALDCGHAASEHSESTTGYGQDPETGEKLCWDCCTAQDIDALKTEDRWIGYLTEHPNVIGTGSRYTVTNWPGGTLFPRVKLVGHWFAYTPTGGYYEVYAVRAIDVHGQHWHGRGEGPGICMHLTKNTKQPT
jgi:hypothetical protein